MNAVVEQWNRHAKPFRVVFYVPYGRRYWECRTIVHTFATEQEARAAHAAPPKGCKKRSLDVATDRPDGDWYFKSLPSSEGRSNG